MKEITGDYIDVDRDLEEIAKGLVADHGVPASIDAADAFTEELYPEIMRLRSGLAAKEGALILEEFPDLQIADQDGYRMPATGKIVRRSTGLHPAVDIPELDQLDTETKRMAAVKAAPWTAPSDGLAVSTFISRISTAAARHTKTASRSTVINTAVLNEAAWARQLSGAEDCPFCTMLAGRGAVYSRDTVGFRTHDNCDCTATVIVDPSADWPGRDEASRIEKLWQKSSGLKEFAERLREDTDHELPA